MAPAQSEGNYSYQLRVRSLDASQPVSEVVKKIDALTPSLARELKDYGKNVQVSIEREKTIPVDPVTIIVLVELANITLKPLLEGFFKKLGEKMADFLTSEVDNAQISIEKEPAPPDLKKEDRKKQKDQKTKGKKNKK